ncbi:MAG: hypothetical protein NDJ75_09145 [Thermoanaerobaculia bacterium]|nr:hypothetical protein [Thermoanaerobaculia bacterium]
MSRSVRWTFASLALFLVLAPLVLAKPGMPMTLKSDEPAYYLMALSLVHDRDLDVDVGDIQRLAVEFPYLAAKNLILATDDGWQTAMFGKPYLVSLVAAPLTALFGANGFVATNMLLFLFSIWLGALYLRQFNPDGLALLFSAGFFTMSNAFAYVFWLHTEILCIASVTACLYLAFTPGDDAPRAGRWGALRAALWNAGTRPFVSGAAILPAAYNKPFLALLALPAFWLAWRRRGARGAAVWLAGAVAAGVVVCAISIALIGKPSAYLGLERQGLSVESFDRMPELPKPRPVSPVTGQAASFKWIFSSFQLGPNFLPNVGFFLVGRHTGLLLYAPFTLLCLLLFARFSRHARERWLLLGCLAGVALYTLTFIWFNWHGGGGFVGNRYYVVALPGFLFLVTRIAPDWLPAVGYALGGLFVGQLLLAPYGAMVPNPTLQAHARNAPFRFFPFEHTLANQIPGQRGAPAGGGSFLVGRADQFRVLDDGLWVVGGQRVELELRTVEPLSRPVFDVSTRIAPNRVRLALDDASHTIDFTSATAPGNQQRVVLAPGPGRGEHAVDGAPYRSYRLVVRAEHQTWHSETVLFRESKKGRGGFIAPAEGEMAPDWEENEVHTLVGAVLVFLGEESELAADVYAVDWLAVPVPESLPAGRIVSFRGRVRNASGGIWRAHGAAAVSLAYHWLAEDGAKVVWEGLRARLPRDVPPGGEAEVVFEVETPRQPGRYRLVFDGVRERIAWFSDRNPASTHERLVEVVAAGRP